MRRWWPATGSETPEKWCDYNQAWTLNYRTSLMIFSESSKEGRREEKLLFDLWKVSSHSHFIAVGQPPRGSEHLFSISVQEERKLRWKQQKTLGEKENRKKNTRKNKSVWNESGWKMKEKTKRNKKQRIEPAATPLAPPCRQACTSPPPLKLSLPPGSASLGAAGLSLGAVSNPTLHIPLQPKQQMHKCPRSLSAPLGTFVWRRKKKTKKMRKENIFWSRGWPCLVLSVVCAKGQGLRQRPCGLLLLNKVTGPLANISHDSCHVFLQSFFQSSFCAEFKGPITVFFILFFNPLWLRRQGWCVRRVR